MNHICKLSLIIKGFLFIIFSFGLYFIKIFFGVFIKCGNIILLILALTIILREISISSLRLFLVSNGIQVSKITPDRLGKLKTFIQMFSLSLLLLYPIFGESFFQVTLFLLLVSTFISLFSLFNYFKMCKSL